MPTPTTRLRAMQQVYNTNPEAWGNFLNVALQMLDNGFGFASVTVDADYTLQRSDYIESEAQKLTLVLTGAGGFTVTAPAVDKPYFVINNCAADVTLEPEGGTGAVIRAGTSVWWYCDGTNGFVYDPALNEMKAPTGSLSLNGQKITNLSPGTASTDAATFGQVSAIAGAAEDAEAAAEAAEAALADINVKFQIVTSLPDPSTLPEGAVVFLIA